MSRLDFSGVVNVQARLRRVAALSRADIEPLLQEGGRILIEDNARGLLAGEDAHGAPMPATQRELGIGSSRREGSGPPLAPKRRQSRAIAWFARGGGAPRYGQDGTGYFVDAGWDSFTAPNGRDILSMHAYPAAGARYPRRDVISRPRPTAVARFREAVRVWAQNLIRRS